MPRPSTPALEPLPLDYMEYAAPVKGARIPGYDFARALAILGMLIDHCIQVIGPRETTGWGAKLMAFIDGRPSAVFVVLSGVGVTLLSRGKPPAQIRRTLFRRGIILLGLGLINQAVWPGDILRMFGVSLIFATCLITLSSRWLLAIAVSIVTLFPLLVGLFPKFYYSNWNWAQMSYYGMWTPVGAVKNILFNGFRPAIPWTGLLVFGMWLGRIDTTRPGVRRNVLLSGIGLWAWVGLMGYLITRLNTGQVFNFREDALSDIVGTESMPPFPAFVLSAVGIALAVIGTSLMIGEHFMNHRFVRTMVLTGQMALSCYVLHIILGAIFVLIFGRNKVGSVEWGLLTGVLFFIMVAAITLAWKRRWRYGPMEALLRSVG